MAVPSGYTPLAKVGMVNKGTYSASATYNNLDFVYYNGSSYVAKKDGLTGVTPAEGANWQYLAKGFLNADATGINIKDTSNLMGSGAGKAVTLQTWGDKVANWLVSKVITNDNFVTKLTERLVNNGTTTSTGFALDARYGKALQDAVNTLNSDKLSVVDGQRKITYQERYASEESQNITAEEQTLSSSDFTITGSYYAIYRAHVSFNSSVKNSKLYFMVNGLYSQGYEIWDGTVQSRRTIDALAIGQISDTTRISFDVRSESLNDGAMTSIGGNTSLNRYNLILIPV